MSRGRGVLARAAASPYTDAVAPPCADNPDPWTLTGDMPTPCLTKAAQSARTRRTVLAAAHELFAEDGYAATSTVASMHRAGVPSQVRASHLRDQPTLLARCDHWVAL